MHFMRAPRSARAVLAGGAVALVVLAAGCNGSSERRAGDAATGDSVPPPNSVGAKAGKVVNPNCGAVFGFQLMNYTTGSYDPKKDGAKKDGFLKSLDDTANKASAAVPELAPSIKILHDQRKAKLEEQPPPANAQGQALTDAGARVSDWQKANC